MSLALSHQETSGAARKSVAVFRSLYDSAHEAKSTEKNPIRWVLRTFYVLVSFVIPMVGICIFILLRDDNPKEAKYPLMGTVVSVAITLAFTAFIIVEYVVFVRPFGAPIIHKIFPEFSSDFIIPFVLP